MEISFSKLVDYPIALEEANLAVLDQDHLVSVGGFQTGPQTGLYSAKSLYQNQMKKYIKQYFHKNVGKYARGFKKEAFLYQISTNQWTKLPNFPGSARQGIRSTTIDQTIYFYGGFSYIPATNISKVPMHKWPTKQGFAAPRDGYSFSRDPVNPEKFIWTRLPDLPYPLSNFAMVSQNRKIYICCGGSEHPNKAENQGKLEVIAGDKIIGINLICLDLDQLAQGWKIISQFPGTARFNVAGSIKDDDIYLIGGIYANPAWSYQNRKKHVRYFSVLDNWKFNLVTNKWSRLTDIPIHNGNFGSQTFNLWKDRYIILMGGAFFQTSIRNHVPEPAIRETKLQQAIKAKLLVDDEFKMNTILVYDLKEDKFFQANPLFNWTNLPSYVILKDTVYALAGEQIPICFQEGYYGLHSDLFVKGSIKEIINASNI